jgi:hypothetical protein
MKYIIINIPKLANLKQMMIFGDVFVHEIMFNTAKEHFPNLEIEVYSAGSCHIGDNKDIYAFGESTSLKIYTKPDASKILNDLAVGLVVTD